jgi:hypothetical protein
MLNILRVPFLGSECGPSEGKDPRSIEQRDCGDGRRFDDLIKAARPQALFSSNPAQIDRSLLDGDSGVKDLTPSIAQKRIALPASVRIHRSHSLGFILTQSRH